MADLANDEGIYIRSMSTRGAMGGIARATLDAVDILDVGGFETIIIETVGVGQDEVEIAKASHTTVVVSAPGLGDDVQALKAGMLEIADVHVVSKCDRMDASRTLADLKQMLTLGLAAQEAASWHPPVVGVSSFTGAGVDELMGAIDRHRAVAFDADSGRNRQLSIASFRLRKTAENLLIERFADGAAPLIPALAEQLQSRRGDPYSLAKELVASSFGIRDQRDERNHQPIGPRHDRHRQASRRGARLGSQ